MNRRRRQVGPRTEAETVERVLEVTNLGVVEYDDGLDLQDDLRRAVFAKEIPDQLLLLEHPPVVTAGRNARAEHVLATPDALARRGILYRETGRGGDVTYHGPGQIVGYPVIDLNPDRRDVVRYVRDLEEVMIRALADFGVAAGRVAGLTGVWVGDRKLAAIGVRISRWVTTHGFAFNVAADLAGFDTIVPCGIRAHGVTSLERELGRTAERREVRERLAARFAEVFGRTAAARGITRESIQVVVTRRTSDGPRVLLVKRTAERGGFWQPITGRIERGEAPAEAARREVREETGLDGEIVSLDHVRDFRIEREFAKHAGPHPFLLREHAFTMAAGDAAVRLAPDEHDDFRWTTPDECRALLRWPGNRRALELTLAHAGAAPLPAVA